MPVADKVAHNAASAVKTTARQTPVAVNAARTAQSSTSMLGATLGATSNFLNTAQMGLFLLPLVSGILGFIGRAPVVGGAFKKASGFVAAPSTFAAENTVESALEKAHGQLSRVVGTDTLSKAGELGSRATDALERAAGKADTYVNGVSKGFAFAKDKISGIKSLTLHDGIYKGSIHVGSALLAYQNVSTTSAGISTLKDMCQDLSAKGERPSTFTILFGKVPDCVKDIRWQFLKTTVIRTIADAVGIGVSTKFAQNQNMGGRTLLMSMGLQMGVGMLSSFVISGNNSAELYKAMKETHASTQQVPAELIAQFIGAADKQAKSAGGAENKAVLILAHKYAAENLNPAQILAKVNSGEINQDRASLKSVQVAEQRAKESGKLKTMSAPTPTPHMHVPASQPNPHAPLPHQPVVGHFTQQYAMGTPFMAPVGRAA